MVVIIIAILASIAMPQYTRATERARAVEAIQLLGAIRGSQHRFKAQSTAGFYTATVNELDVGLPVATKYWGTAPSSVTTTRAIYTRVSGPSANQTLGLFYDNGEFCGNFAPMGTMLAC
jgi:type II secretory pathway pseudopilin PulG